MKLALAAADGQLVEHEVTRDTYVIGRSSRADLTIADRSMSREHARFFSQGEDWFVEDLGSHNGTRVNRDLLAGPKRLRHGDVVMAGDCTLIVALGGRPVPQPAHAGEPTLFRSARELLGPPSETADTGLPPGEVGRRLTERLKLLNEVNHALATSISLEELLELILDRAFEHLAPVEAAVYLREPDGRDVCAARRCAPGRESRTLHSRSLLAQVVDHGMAARVVDAALDERFAGAASLLEAGVRTLIAAPLLDAQGALGMIVLGAAPGGRSYGEEDMELLVSLASVAALRIRNVRLVAEALEKQLLEQDLRLARAIQVALLPSSLPDVPGYELHAGNVPSRGVSGDFYKLSLRSEGRECVLFQADVSGKGVGAALLTASLEALLAVPLSSGQEPGAVCELVSTLLFERTPPEKYATAFLAVLDLPSGRLTWVNAGHNAPLLLRAAGGSEWLGSNGFPLGLRRGAGYASVTTTLEPGDLVVVYTDGISEAANPAEEEFGLPRLLAAALTHRHLPARELALALEHEVDAFAEGEPYADDRTLVVLRRVLRRQSTPFTTAR